MKHLPMKDTNLGRVLRAMHNAAPMSAGHIRRKAGLAPDTAVTARIRDLRKMGIDVDCQGRRELNEKTVWYYQIERMPQWVSDALREERKREQQVSGVAA